MADSIFHNCDVITSNEAQPEATAIAVKNGCILGVGDNYAMSKFKVADTTLIDMEGRTILPGLIEVHTHPIWSGIHANVYLDISGLKPTTKQQIWEAIAARAKQVRKDEWLMVYGYNPILVPNMTVPTIQKLDELAPDVPVIVMTQSGHSAFFNSKALALSGVTKDTPNPEGGEFVRDKNGELTGMANENPAIQMFTRKMPRVDTSRGRAYFRQQLHSYSTNGYTTIAATGMFGSFKGAYNVVEEMLNKRDAPVRLAVYHRENVIRGRVEKLARGNPGRDNYTFIGVKFWSDGSPYSGTMATQDPYLDNQLTREGLGFNPYPNYGSLNFTEQGLYDTMLPYHKLDLQMSVHAHGERAIQQSLDVYEALLRHYPRYDHRYRLEHCGLITEEQLERALHLGVTPSFFPDHIHYFGDALNQDILGTERAARFMPLNTATKVGHRWSSHSDTPCCPLGPFRAMKTIVTRAARRNDLAESRSNLDHVTRDSNVIGPGEIVGIDDAIKAYTINPAWQIFHEPYIGSIEVGKIADFTVVTENPRKIDPYELDTVGLCATYKDGKKVNWVGARM